MIHYATIFVFLFINHLSDEIPNLNNKVVEYVDSVIGKQVGRGECWDLAASALDHAGAYLDRSSQKTIYIFGKEVNPAETKIFPGDILQMSNLKIEYTEDNIIYTESMPHHTAIVYEVLANNHYKIAHQNTSFSGRKVGLSELRMSDIKKGKIIFYRPYRK
jgi:hypothetical protein